MQSDIGWSIDFEYAGIPRVGDEEYTLRAAGLRGSITSKRSHLVLVDDPIKSSADIRNPTIRSEMESNWSSVIAPIVFVGRSLAYVLVLVSTRWISIKRCLSLRRAGSRWFKRRLRITM